MTRNQASTTINCYHDLQDETSHNTPKSISRFQKYCHGSWRFRPQDMLIEKSKINDNDNDDDYDHEEEEEKLSGRLNCMISVLNIFCKFLRLTPSTQEVNVEHLKKGKQIYYKLGFSSYFMSLRAINFLI
ncbi:hypothetical protein H5410_055011 [Solanum commersonii]|uniref:Uncharacterized protein n=1 Tax=Solanum commersonii TaxID=4109 RepID=A0A9J5WHE9_SOLCO|nr:hypothetical protein H5410_055011 [Solanum commersonii]